MRIRLLGSPVSHSLSPVFQNAAIRAAGINARYEAVMTSPEELRCVRSEFVRGALHGANVTIPYKTLAAGLADVPSLSVQSIGAANTLWKQPSGQIVASNTDIAGVEATMQSLGLSLGFRPGVVVLLGAGGAALAAAWACVNLGLRVELVCRSPANVDEAVGSLCSTVRGWTATSVRHAMREGDGLVIDATSVGLLARDAAGKVWESLELSSIPPSSRAMTMAYGPSAASFLEAVRHLARAGEDGLSMLLHQGAVSFALWFGTLPPLEVMRDALVGAVGGRDRALDVWSDTVRRHVEQEKDFGQD